MGRAANGTGRRLGGTLRRVARVLIFWTHPQHLSVAEADAWARGELRKVAGLAAVERAELTQLRDRVRAPRSPVRLDARAAPGARR